MAALAPDPVGPLEEAEHLRLTVAGAESNVAMYLADHGVPVAWLSALGDDAPGRRVRAALAPPRVDRTPQPPPPHPPPRPGHHDPPPGGH
ncbi:PfkB family carbohydrate kinase, partial [Streptomyces sp. NPDC059466]|uniref:PfkB family carbohydrate kinase n=1 Tax=Streptomyces sp. NPDC059466 TaxID=3346843 RepID=UPI0036A3A308